VVTVLTNRAIPAEQLDAATASAELERARTQAAPTVAEQEAKSRAVDRARAQVRIASKRP